MSANTDSLMRLLDTPGENFGLVFDQMKHEQKADFRQILIYVDKVVDDLLERQNTSKEVECVHIHFPSLNDQFSDVILEFLASKFFFREVLQDKGGSDYITKRLSELHAKLKRLNHFPSDASAQKGGNKKYKEWRKTKIELLEEIQFLQGIGDTGQAFSLSVVLNLLIHDAHVVEESFFIKPIEEILLGTKAYVAYNTSTFNKLILELSNAGLMGKIREIVLFDCSGRSYFSTCTKNNLEQYLPEGLSVDHLIVVSFNKRSFRLKHIIDKFTTIYQRHFGLPLNGRPRNGTYVFPDNEMQNLIGKSGVIRKIEWMPGVEKEIDEFLKLTFSLELPALRTIYVHNIFMSAITTRFATRIHKHLFDIDSRSAVFNEEVYNAIDSLDDSEKEQFSNVVNSLLMKIADLWYSARVQIINIVQNHGTIAVVVPLAFLNDTIFKNEIGVWLSGHPNKLYSWRDIKEDLLKESYVIILNYKDPGRYPFAIFPNIIEVDGRPGTIFQAFFLKSFFKKRFEQCYQEYHSELSKWTDSNFRRKHFPRQVYRQVNNADDEVYTFEDIDEQEYDLGEPIGMIELTFSDGAHVRLHPSKPLMIQRQGRSEIKVVRADQLVEDEIGSKVQLLEDFHRDLNLFEIRPEEESELANIRALHNVNASGQVLWKVLLARLRQKESDESLFEQMSNAVGERNFIHYDYFKNNWLNPQSGLLIPRKRRHFKALCAHLGLSPEYYRLKLKKSASEKWSRRDSTQRKNKLLKQMFDEGLFEYGFDWIHTNLDHFLVQHDLEAHGITEEVLKKELHALVELLKENIQLKSLQNIKLP